MILHILTQSPGTETFRQCLAGIKPGDGLLLTQNAVYTDCKSELSLPAETTIYALSADRQARGLPGSNCGIELIDYSGFVALTLKYDKTVTW